MDRKRALLALFLSVVVVGSASAASTARPTGLRTSSDSATAVGHVAPSDRSFAVIELLREPFIRGVRIYFGLGVVDVDSPNDDGGFGLDGVTDGSDPTDPLGAKENGVRQSGPLPGTSATPRR
jgi:hypothetical protein